jgi:predicted site-specific integrase-resolvase
VSDDLDRTRQVLPDHTWLTSRDAAKVIGCSVARVAHFVRSGQLRADARGRGSRLMFRYSTVKRFAAERATASGVAES